MLAEQFKSAQMLGGSEQFISYALGVLFVVRQKVLFVWQMPIVNAL